MGLQAWINMVLVRDQVFGQGSGLVVHDIAVVVHEATCVISKFRDDMRFSGKKSLGNMPFDGCDLLPLD